MPYVAAAIPQQLLQQWTIVEAAKQPELHLPPRNSFIPTDFSLRCGGTDETAAPNKKQKKVSPSNCYRVTSPSAGQHAQ